MIFYEQIANRVRKKGDNTQKKSKTWLARVREIFRHKEKTFDIKLKVQAWAVQMEQTMTLDTIVLGKTLCDVFERYQKRLHPPASHGEMDTIVLINFHVTRWQKSC